MLREKAEAKALKTASRVSVTETVKWSYVKMIYLVRKTTKEFLE